MNRRAMITAGLLIASAASVGLARQPGDVSPVSAPAAAVPMRALEARIANLDNRLAALSPARPKEYFEIGEEVLAEASDHAHRRLARELFVLALVLERRSGKVEGDAEPSSGAGVVFADQPSVGASACLALAFMAESEDERRWLSALAATLGSDPAVDLSPARSTAVSRDPAALELATLLGWVRAGEGRRAARILERPGVSALLDKCDKLLIPVVGGGSDRVRRLIEQYPICQQCRNRRSIKGPDGVTLCPSCKGRPGVSLPSREIVNQLKVESMLLSGVQRSWAGQIAADGGSPLRDLDPSEVALALGVDPARSLWRDGRWAVDPAGAAPPGPPATGDAAASSHQQPQPSDGEATSWQPTSMPRP